MSVRSTEILPGNRLKEYLRDEVQSSLASRNVQVSETTEFYLVNLLSDFERSEYLYILQDNRFEEEPLAVMLARILTGDRATQLKGLKRLGDVALYITGLFGDHIEKGPVGKRYYIDMGSSAYAELSSRLISEEIFADLYSELANEFTGLSLALSELSVAKSIRTNLDLLKLYERWIRTGDEKIRERLMREGLIPVDKKISC